jgi:radical SAM protein with 4Fe4S-binding SPASM domain
MMSYEKFKSIIDELGRWLFKVRLYSWGEPLLNTDIYRMIEYANHANIGTELSSNFNHFSTNEADKLIDSGLELLILSLDGAKENTYLQYRVGGSFKTVTNNIRTLVKKKESRRKRFPFIEIQFLAMKHNEHEIQDIKKLSKELGVDRLRIAPLTVNVRDQNQIDEWLPSDKKWSRYDYQRNGSLKIEDKIYENRKRCEWLWRSAVINWDGTVSPCCVYEGPKTDFGSLNKESFQHIWNNQHYQLSRSIFAKNNSQKKDSTTICTRCKGIPTAFDKKQKGLY